MDDTSVKPAKPFLLQSGSELMDTTLGEKATDAATASGCRSVKAISEGRMPSRHSKAQGR